MQMSSLLNILTKDFHSPRQKLSIILLLTLLIKYARCGLKTNLNDIEDMINPDADPNNIIRINKCCEKFEIFVDSVCTVANDTKADTWKPSLKDTNGKKFDGNYSFTIGIPKCGSMQLWSIYHYYGSPDELVLLPNGKLRHYTHGLEENKNEYNDEDYLEKEPMHHDYDQGFYCIDKGISYINEHKEYMYAKVCSPGKELKWTDADFILRKIINPILHLISISVLLIVSIIYFVLPTLRDLIGNIITTITVCLMIGQAADLVRIFTEFSNHVSFLVADSFIYVSILGAFFWLNSFGYYVWKTFRSRNVFLRVSDSKKYCWYSCYAWGGTGIMSALAIFSHYFIDSAVYKQQKQVENQETIGWLGIAMFFSPIAIIILVNIFFYVSTQQLISKRSIYGRIQHKLKTNFIMFSLLFLIMGISWLFLILSWLKYDGLLYTHIFVNAMQAPLILYVCVLRQKHITFLLKKSCCYNEPVNTTDFGDEMVHMNGFNY